MNKFFNNNVLKCVSHRESSTLPTEQQIDIGLKLSTDLAIKKGGFIKKFITQTASLMITLAITITLSMSAQYRFSGTQT